MQNCLLSVANVSKAYDGVRALRSVSFDVPEGTFFGIIGPSGSGKSTLLKIICGVDTPTEGSVLYKGVRLSPGSPELHDVVMVWQSLALFPHMNVQKNVAFGLSVRNLDQQKAMAMTSDALQMVGLGGYEKRRVYELSGGEQQRVALARGLAVKPKILLLDEPLGSVDAYLRGEIQAELRRLHRETGITFVMVTHDQTEALALSTRIAVINGGRIEQIGTPTEIMKSPRTPFVARFVGDRNVLEGTVEKMAGRSCLVKTQWGTFEAAANVHEDQIGPGAEVVYVIDAADVKEGMSFQNSLSGTFLGAAIRGSSQLIRLGLTQKRTFLYEVFGNAHNQNSATDREILVSWPSEKAYVLVISD